MIVETSKTLSAGKIKRIHVDQHRIKANTKNGTDLPTITVQTSEGPYKAHEVEMDGPVRMIYRPHDPLSCGARLWCETTGEVRTIVRDGEEC